MKLLDSFGFSPNKLMRRTENSSEITARAFARTNQLNEKGRIGASRTSLDKKKEKKEQIFSRRDVTVRT